MEGRDIRHLVPRLQKALDLAKGTHTLADLEAAVLQGDAKLWLHNDALVFTEIQMYPQKRILHIWLAAGKLEDTIALLPELYEYGREQDCDSISIVGRKGWTKYLLARGWESTLVHYIKEL